VARYLCGSGTELHGTEVALSFAITFLSGRFFPCFRSSAVLQEAALDAEPERVARTQGSRQSNCARDQPPFPYLFLLLGGAVSLLPSSVL
jgi:hypothetical protein